MIRLSYSPKVWCIVKGMTKPHKMWNTLETSLDTDGLYLGRQNILHQVRACWPKEDKSLDAYFTKVCNYHIHPVHTGNAITNRDFHMLIFSTLPLRYPMILMVLKHKRPLSTAAEAMHNLLEEETTASHMNDLGDAATEAVVLLQHGGYRGRDHGCRCTGGRRDGGSGELSGSSGSGDSSECKFTYCKIDSHPTDACRRQNHTQEGGNNRNDVHIYFQCRLPGYEQYMLQMSLDVIAP